MTSDSEIEAVRGIFSGHDRVEMTVEIHEEWLLLHFDVDGEHVLAVNVETGHVGLFDAERQAMVFEH